MSEERQVRLKWIRLFADYCWQMMEYWFAWHLFWVQLVEVNKE